MSELALVRLVPDLDRLARAAAAHGLIGAGGDFGYALHAALAAAFGDLAPKPFLLRAEIRRAAGRARRRTSDRALPRFTSEHDGQNATSSGKRSSGSPR